MNMKKIVIMSIFSIIVLVILMTLIISNTAITTPEQTVARFYAGWFNGKFMLSDNSYQNANELSQNFKIKINSIISSFSSGGYDPIVCAQDFPKSFKIVPITTSDTTAEISVREYFDTLIKDIRISLIRENALWKITDINCGDMQQKNPPNIK